MTLGLTIFIIILTVIHFKLIIEEPGEETEFTASTYIANLTEISERTFDEFD